MSVALRVCIPTAGTGSRLGDLTRYVNKSLVSVANRPILSHLIEQFPQNAEFVIALGHKGHLVREFLELAYPERTFFYADVAPFEGLGSGLGLSLLQCRPYLQQPFVFISCDTLVEGAIPCPEKNWMGYAESEGLSPYRTLRLENGKAMDICEKGYAVTAFHKPYIGLAGIADHADFWQAMETGGDTAIANGEAHGLRALLTRGIAAYPFVWHDTGNPQALAATRDRYRKSNAPNILDKPNEAIWFVGGQVIKFSDDEKFIANRARRATDMGKFAPEISGVRPHMYRYEKVEGRVLSEAVTLPLFHDLLRQSKLFWQLNETPPADAAFRARCMKFYKNKTFERVQLFYDAFGKQDGREPINGVAMPLLSALLNELNWDWLAGGLPCRFHGDFHFENILWSETTKSFTFLDWRQDFGGSLASGDVYYDLAKLLHGLIVCHELIAVNAFAVAWNESGIRYDLPRKPILLECERAFEAWLAQNSFDVTKVKILTALIYLNIAALHHHPYCLLLYALGKFMLFENAPTRHATH